MLTFNTLTPQTELLSSLYPDWRLSFDSEALWERAPLAASDKDDPRNSGVVD
ncbi:MAG: hypothetical protein CM15mP49_02890 [Actinomycetota bacterium]|nr:MAG: hypothetical protein CM15mP49_02890 [Actinomycetota bacterium]